MIQRCSIRRFVVVATIVSVGMGGGVAQAVDLPSDSLPLAKYVLANGALQAPTARLVAMAEVEIESTRNGRQLEGGYYALAGLSRVLAVVLALERVATRGDAPVAGPLAEAYFQLDRVADRLTMVTALEDVGEPVWKALPPAEQARAKDYAATVRAIGPHCSARVQALLDATPGEGEDLARMYRFSGRFFHHRYESEKALAPFERLVKVSEDPDDRWEAAVPAIVLLPDAEAARERLRALVAKMPELRPRADPVVQLQASLALLRKAQAAALAAPDSIEAQLDLLDAALELGWPGNRTSYDTIRRVEARLPNDISVETYRLRWLGRAGVIEGVNAMLELVDTTGSQPTRTKLVSAILSGRIMAILHNMARLGVDDSVGEQVSAAERELAGLRQLDSYTRAMAQTYLGWARALRAEPALLGAVGGAIRGELDDAGRERLRRANKRLLEPTLRKHREQLDTWKMRVLAGYLVDTHEMLEGLPKLVEEATRRVHAEQKNETSLFAVYMLSIAGRRAGGAPHLRKALERAEALRAIVHEHHRRRLADLELAVDRCPEGGCVDIGALYAMLGAVRNTLRGTVDEGELSDWDRDTIRRMRQGDRVLRELELDTSRAHAQVSAQRCWAALMGRMYDQAGLCVEDLFQKHGHHDEVVALYAGVLASARRLADAAAGFRQVVASRTAAAGIQYDALKWLAHIELGAGNDVKAREHVRAALALRPRATRMELSLEHVHVVFDGKFDIGIGLDRVGELGHSVTLAVGPWVVMRAPIDDSLMESFIND